MTASWADKEQPNIMIVDDTPENLRLLENMLRSTGYEVRALPSGKMALAAAAKTPPDLILLDINMPEMDGYEVCARLKADERLKEIPVIFLSALHETEDKLKAFSAGGVDYITKPFQFEEVNARVETHLRIRHLQKELEKHNLHLQDLVDAQVKEISDSQMATIFALAKLSETRDTGTGAHLERVQDYCRTLAEGLLEYSAYAKHIDYKFITNLYRSSPLHDIGKVAIPDAILLKPGKLTPKEFEVMKKHSAIGADTLLLVLGQYPNNKFIQMGIEIARSHHERWDGRGYPDGLTEDRIPLAARIMAVVDVYDALRSRRCYKEPVGHAESLAIIQKGDGSQFDPAIVKVFTNLSDKIASVWRP